MQVFGGEKIVRSEFIEIKREERSSISQLYCAMINKFVKVFTIKNGRGKTIKIVMANPEEKTVNNINSTAKATTYDAGRWINAPEILAIN
jgi:hypothetical protein